MNVLSTIILIIYIEDDYNCENYIPYAKLEEHIRLVKFKV
jgi:hypothetical protein